MSLRGMKWISISPKWWTLSGRAGSFLISSDGGKITGLEKVRKNQFLLTIEEFKELAKEAGCIDETESKLQ